MWVYLGIAFILGMAAYRWVFGGGNALSQEDLAAELAAVRTRSEERETEHRRLRSRVTELGSQLDDAKREARSFEAEARAAKLELEQMKIAVDVEARAAARREREAPPAGEPLGEPPVEAAAESTEPTTPATGAVETVSFMAALREGAPDDLTKIRGIGQKLESTLNGLGIYYYRQIADWSDGDIEAMDAKLKFPGRIHRDDWRGQARKLLGRPAPPAGDQ
jgi:predicted flap endonuclease-1-like 5' DNA nuclease